MNKIMLLSIIIIVGSSELLPASNYYVSPGLQIGINSSKEFFWSYQINFGILTLGVPAITIGERFYKIDGKKWDSFSYADVQLSHLLDYDGGGIIIGTGTGLILNEKELFYKYKIFTGLFGLISYDYINFKNKPKNHWGGFVVFPFTNAKP